MAREGRGEAGNSLCRWRAVQRLGSRPAMASLPVPSASRAGSSGAQAQLHAHARLTGQRAQRRSALSPRNHGHPGKAGGAGGDHQVGGHQLVPEKTRPVEEGKGRMCTRWAQRREWHGRSNEWHEAVGALCPAGIQGAARGSSVWLGRHTARVWWFVPGCNPGRVDQERDGRQHVQPRHEEASRPHRRWSI